jgi:lysophospholipase L1-like esterase
LKFCTDYGPVPPWLDSLRILESDDELVWKSRPNLHRKYIDVFSPVQAQEERASLLRQFVPTTPKYLLGKPVWEISLNSWGFRDQEFSKVKPMSTFRILCLGDSWTFGANVGQEDAYPQRLGGLLRQEIPEANFEVFNLGVLGYASYNGIRLLRKVMDLGPDLVVIGFAMNEPNMAGFTKKRQETISGVKGAGQILEYIESYKLLRYGFLLSKWKPMPITHQFKGEGSFRAWQSQVTDSGELEPWMSDSLREYENRILEMIALARSHDATVVLLYPEFWLESPYRTVLQEISSTKGLPLVDSSEILLEARRKIENDLEKTLDLRSSESLRTQPNNQIEVILRVFMGEHPVPNAVSIVGDHPNLGNLVPNKVVMYDDGTHGDQKADDKVWSYETTFPPGAKLSYVYTNSGAEGEWKGLDLPAIRHLDVGTNANQKHYAPIDTFGRMYMYADPWHTNAEGYKLIAKALIDVLKKYEMVKENLSVSNRS